MSIQARKISIFLERLLKVTFKSRKSPTFDSLFGSLWRMQFTSHLDEEKSNNAIYFFGNWSKIVLPTLGWQTLMVWRQKSYLPCKKSIFIYCCVHGRISIFDWLIRLSPTELRLNCYHFAMLKSICLNVSLFSSH